MTYQFPHTIQNCTGERLIFKELIREKDGDKLLVENYVQPKSGPPMHTHFLQDESLTVVNGRIGYQVMGEELKYAGEGETVTFKRGSARISILAQEPYGQPHNTYGSAKAAGLY